jgi:hypothetical protein
MSTATDYLDTLNLEQRRAVEHGVCELNIASAGPLLVITGAGSGKTDTLAHRVARLIANGSRRSVWWLLMTGPCRPLMSCPNSRSRNRDRRWA